MRYRIEDYEQFAGKGFVDRIQKLAKPLEKKHVVHLNSTYYGGGVAEILSSLIMLLNDAGVITGWRILKGNDAFFSITKKLHNTLQGDDKRLSAEDKSAYININHVNSAFTHLGNHDLVIVHDPQPLPMIKFYRKECPWIWRCHIDLSRPNINVWNYLKQFIMKYDAVVFSAQRFRQTLPIPQFIIPPAIDPLDPKNMEMKDRDIDRQLRRFGIPRNKPIIAQISRFDRWKDPSGVIDAFRIIKKKTDCRLVLLGAMATDDPEGSEIYRSVLEKAAGDDNIHIISYQSDLLVNALQRASSVIIQNSIKEGFGLTVSEAMWKQKPVVTRKVGGISLQVKHGYNGYFATNLHSLARSTMKLLNDRKLAAKMGKNGKERVEKNFLITQLLENHIRLYRKILKLN